MESKSLSSAYWQKRINLCPQEFNPYKLLYFQGWNTEEQDKGAVLTAVLKSRVFEGVYFSSEKLDLYCCYFILESSLCL